MWRFVLSENVRRYQTLVADAGSEAERAKLEQLILDSQLELEDLEQASTPEIARHDEALKFFVERVTDEALKALSAQFSTLQIYDETREHLIILAQKNFRAPFLHHLALMKPGDGSACGRCLADDAPAAVKDVNGDPGFAPHRAAAAEAGFQAVHAAPVRNRSGALIAVLSTYFGAPQQFSGSDLRQIESFAGTIGPNLAKYLSR